MSPGAEAAEQALIGAEAAPEHTGIVRLTHRDQDQECSGTLIASRLVLTALHCVVTSSGETREALLTDGFRVFFGPDASATTERNAMAVAWIEGALPGVVDEAVVAGEDVAVLELSEPAPADVRAYTPVFDYRPDASELLTLVGYGLVSIETGQGGVRRAAAAALTGFDSDTGVLQLSSDEPACFGDSGGAVLQDDGALVAVIGQAAGTSDASFCDTELSFAASLANPTVSAFVRQQCARVGGCGAAQVVGGDEDAGVEPVDAASADAGERDAAPQEVPPPAREDAGRAQPAKPVSGCAVAGPSMERRASGTWCLVVMVLALRWWLRRRRLLGWLLVACASVALGCSDSDAMHDADAGDSATPGEDPDAAQRGDATDVLEDATVPDADAAFDADTGVPIVDGGPDSEVPDAYVHPISEYCGDAIRDPVTEECDDGDDELGDLCLPDCRAAPSSLLADAVAPPSIARRLGEGPHLVADHGAGFVAVYVESDAQPKVWAQRFDENGVALGAPLHVSAGTTPAGEPNPSVATLPDGRAVVAWTDATAGMPDVVMRPLPLTGAQLPAVVPAHVSSSGPQQDADLIWSGNELVVAWTDLLDVKLRRFDAQLAALGAVQSLANSADIEGGVTLARSGSTFVAAYRSVAAGLERVRVVRDGVSWYTPEAPPSPTADRPALIALEDGKLLLAYTIGTDPGATGTANIGRLRMAFVDPASPGQLTPQALDTLEAPYGGDVELAQRRPTLARSGSLVLVAWEQSTPVSDTRAQDVVVQELHWTNVALDTPIDRSLDFFATLSRDDHQRAPALGTVASFPSGAIALLWEQQTGAADPDAWLALRATPLVTLSPP